MWKITVLFLCLSGYSLAGPVGPKRNILTVQQKNDVTAMEKAIVTESAVNVDPNEMNIMSTLTLPSNATSIRGDITDGFSCGNRIYGYYADVENDCQIFHVCLPVTYADGTENTFRWSFICPEETIFSQESFTCMRPDDMTISCEESYQYYELNRNFGMADTENNEAIENNKNNEIKEEAETTSQAKPVVHEEEKFDVKPNVQLKPVKVPKPVRRKPSVSSAMQKKPLNTYPLRKAPQIPVQTEEADTGVIPIVEEKKINPIEQKLSRRPVAITPNTSNDKIQTSKPETVMTTRTEFFNQKRKRPTMFNKKPVAVQEKKEEEDKIKTKAEQQNFSTVEPVMPNANADTSVADSENEASENNHVFVNPEESIQNKIVQNAEEEPVQVLEAFEEIPALISEFVEEPQVEGEVQASEEMETHKDSPVVEKNDLAEKADTVQESQATEETSEDEQNLRISAEQTQNIEGSTTAEETQVSKEPQTYEEAQTSEGIQNIQVAKDTQTNQESQTVEGLVSEEGQAVEESQNAEKIQTVEESQTIDESKGSEEPQLTLDANEELQTAEKTLTVEEKPSEVPQSSIATADENHNSEKNIFSKVTPAVDEVQIADDVSAPKETQFINNSHADEISKSGEETQLAEKATEAIQKVEETQNTKEYQNAQDFTNIDKITSQLEQSAVILKPQQIEDVSSIEFVPNVEKSQTIEDATPVKEDSIPIEFSLVPTAEETINTENIAEPAIFEENSEEGAQEVPAQTIEEMESEKPAEAPEFLQSTEEMSHPDAMVQEMYEDMDANKQSIGGFKPVDPVMAHEAEQLIFDFINTLRKNDFTNETPGMKKEHNNGELPEQEQSQENDSEIQETERAESHEVSEEESEKVEEEETNETEEIKEQSEPKLTKTQADFVENNAEKVQVVHEEGYKSNELENMEVPQKFEEASVHAMNIPQEMYQIPVKVITTPIEEMSMTQAQLHKGEVEPANTEGKAEEETSPMIRGGHKPLSIDDIVELVKERLDHMPKNEMETPMQLEQVLEEAAEDKVPEQKVEEHLPVQETEQHQTMQSEEDVVLPIYERTVQPNKIDAGIQTDNLEQVQNEEQSEVSDVVTDANEKSNRSYRSRSMLTPKLDPRKRHFLFKTDSS